MPSFLVTRSFGIEQAGLTSALGIAFSVPAPFAVGLLVSRVKSIRLATVLLLLTAGMQVSLPLAEGKASISALLVGLGIFQPSTSPTIFVFMTELVPALRLPEILGWSVALGYGGAAVGPVVFGGIVDATSFSA